MAKNKTTKNKKDDKKFIEKRVKANNSVEYVVTKSPSKTWWGKFVVILIVVGTLVLPIVALIVTIVQGIK